MSTITASNKILIGRLPDQPTKDDLLRFSKIRLRKKRSKKKFNKYWYRYIPDSIYAEFMAKTLVRPIINPINYAEIGKKLLHVEPLGPPAGLVHYMDVKYGMSKKHCDNSEV